MTFKEFLSQPDIVQVDNLLFQTNEIRGGVDVEIRVFCKPSGHLNYTCSLEDLSEVIDVRLFVEDMKNAFNIDAIIKRLNEFIESTRATTDVPSSHITGLTPIMDEDPDREAMVSAETWETFRKTGLLWWVNAQLHLFGWAIVCEVDEADNVTAAFPARVKFRGFDEEITDNGYRKVTNYLADNIKDLKNEVSE